MRNENKDMTLHVFNPEHDIALGANLANFTAPRAGRQLRADLGWLPALWAADGDMVMVGDVASASRQWKRLAGRIAVMKGVGCSTTKKEVIFVSGKELVRTKSVTAIDVWGWDRALRAELTRKGVDISLLPADDYLERVRQLSHRRTAAHLLPQLRHDGTVGEAFECDTTEEVEEVMNHYGRVVVKAPWSSSGRGVRFIAASNRQTSFDAWLRNVLVRQGSVLVEPYYNKVMDFGLEFYADGRGSIRYEGLSLFHTANGAYTGNILATEQAKREMLSRYVSLPLLDSICEGIIAGLDLADYCGPFGIDMMAVRADNQLLLHPCIEINLRRTMGHVALALSPVQDDVCRVMRINYTDRYRISVRIIVR